MNSIFFYSCNSHAECNPQERSYDRQVQIDKGLEAVADDCK